MASNETPTKGTIVTNIEVLAMAIQTISTKKTKEIHITLECGCEMIFAPLVEDTDKAMVGKLCKDHDHLL